MSKYAIEFSNKKSVYRWNKHKKVLELTDEVIDLQELINSNRNQTIDELFDRLLYTKEEKNERKQKQLVREYQDKLDMAEFAKNQLDELKSSLGVDLTATTEELVAVINDKKEKISNMKFDKDIEKKEIEKDEKKVDEAQK